jgi:hypothetical protein
VFRTALDAVANLLVRVLLTVGRATDIDALGEIPRVQVSWRDVDLAICR